MGVKQTVREIREFEKSKFVKFGLDYKRLLKQIKRTGKKVRIMGKFVKSGTNA